MLCGLQLVQSLVIQEVKFDVKIFSKEAFKTVIWRGHLPPETEPKLKIKH